MKKMFLPDVNVWLALTFDSHVHHVQAKHWFDGLSDRRCAFCRLTQQGFLRLITNPKAFAQDAVTMDRAWELYDALLGDERVIYSDEPAEIEPAWRQLTRGQSFSPKVWNDAYLAAFAKAADLEIATCDKGFKQYLDLRVQFLS
jgi:uncharacterized protein